MFGQAASSHTVFNFAEDNFPFKELKLSDVGA
jgi:hypothetical protein